MSIYSENPLSQRALTLATIAFAASFSVWTLYAVIGLHLQEALDLSATQLGILFASPMLTGSLARIPVGLLSDKYNPKTIYTLQMLIVVPALLLLPYVQSFNEYLLLGLWIGISGTSFTVGIRYVNDWFSRGHQGTAMGIFGAGNAGAAITLLIAPIIIDKYSLDAVGPVYAAGLLAMAGLFSIFAPRFSLPSETLSEKLPLREYFSLQVWRFGLYYYFVFGSFLALLLWLPQYYVNAYKLTHETAMALTLIFATSSSMVRALGGWVSDRYGGRSVNWNVFWICLACLFFLSYPPTTMTIHGVDKNVNLTIEVNVIIFSILIFVIGIAQGFGRASVYKIIHDYYPDHMGSIGGFVAALGALGGCTLPIAFGLSVDFLGIHSACFMLLYGVLAACMVVMFFANKADRLKQRVEEAHQYNFLEQE